MEAGPITLGDRLIRELSEQCGLSAVDANRAAFVALAARKGWTKAKIGRYLGTSRARVGQKLEKLEHYAATEQVPTLKRVLGDGREHMERRRRDRKLGAIKREPHRPLDSLAYQRCDWRDLDFARGLIEIVS